MVIYHSRLDTTHIRSPLLCELGVACENLPIWELYNRRLIHPSVFVMDPGDVDKWAFDGIQVFPISMVALAPSSILAALTLIFAASLRAALNTSLSFTHLLRFLPFLNFDTLFLYHAVFYLFRMITINC